MAIAKITPVILCGGAGSRLWPLSRSMYPKQLLALYTENTMLQDTALRVAGDLFAPTIVISNHEYRFIVAEQMRTVGIGPVEIILEPMGRNTAAAATVAALRVYKKNPDAIVLLLPSDHVIEDVPAFHKAIEQGTQAAQNGAMVIFGIQPTQPETGYGYIKRGEVLEELEGCYVVDRFVEKPDLATAINYLKEGDYLWNGGIFLFSAKYFLDEVKGSNPGILTACELALREGRADMDFFLLDELEFGKVESDSIDYAVMEKTKTAVVVPMDIGWSDVGSWSALWSIGEKDEHQNVVQGDVRLINTRNSYVRSQKGLVAVIGLSDVIVVNTEDALLVASKKEVQDVKSLVETLKTEGRDEVIISHRIYRPWGWYETHFEGPGFLVKRISVNPGAALSLQRHAHRAEHWVVVSGVATVTKGSVELQLNVNQSIYIPVGEIHRLQNSTEEPVLIIEVQTGDYLSEDDIERLQDTYGRSSS
jgi:mannose-1-phosphate guanylyltransferase / mannose-6-phosphate isomerase